jgi:CRISPR type I-E-associated protein CasA/Cse1
MSDTTKESRQDAPWNVLTSRWLEVMNLNAEAQVCSPLEALNRASEIQCIVVASPLDFFAAHRFLLTLLYWKADVAGGVQKVRESLLRGELPRFLLDAIGAEDSRFRLFDDSAPFLQDPSAQTGENARPASDLIAELPADTNINHSRHAYDNRVALCPACCALGMLRLAPFCGQGGQGKAPSINGRSPPVYFLPVGETLFHTLLLNWSLGEPVEGDRPAWEEGTNQGRDRIGLLEGFTWEPRSVRLIAEDGRGESCTLCGRIGPQLVRRIIFQKGRDRGDQRLKAWRDPHVAYAEETSKKGAKRVRSLHPPEPVLNPDAAAGFWREVAAALLRSGHGDASTFSSAAVAAARLFRPSDGLTVFAVATHTRQAKVLHDRLDLWTLPPPDEQRDQTLTAELGWLADGLAKLPGLASRDEFERRAERHFRALLGRRGEGLPDLRAAILADLHALTRPVAMPGRALEYQRAAGTTQRAVNTCFPVPEGTQ